LTFADAVAEARLTAVLRRRKADGRTFEIRGFGACARVRTADLEHVGVGDDRDALARVEWGDRAG